MRTAFLLLLVLSISGCDRGRLYERNFDFEDRVWISANQPAFEFEVTDTAKAYNLFCNIRNSVDYPYSRIFITYSLQDSAGKALSKNMISTFLFEEKTGRPLGSSSLGAVYDQQVPILKNYQFKKTGTFSVHYEQFMRTDTLKGILAVGFRLESAMPSE